MKTFYLQRDEDATGVSGTGRVAEGVVFSTGWVALQWLTEINSIVFYPNLDNVRQIHGHGGMTRIVFHDDIAEQLTKDVLAAVSKALDWGRPPD